MFNECLYIFDKHMAELLAQFRRLKQTKISRLGSDWYKNIWLRLVSLLVFGG